MSQVQPFLLMHAARPVVNAIMAAAGGNSKNSTPAVLELHNRKVPTAFVMGVHAI